MNDLIRIQDNYENRANLRKNIKRVRIGQI